MSLEQFATSGGKSPQQSAAPSAPAETDEDLFDFDALTASAIKAAAAGRRELDEALEHVEAAKVEVKKSFAPAPQPAVAPLPRVAVPVAPVAPREAAPPPSATVVHQRLTVSPVAALLLGGVVLANVVLMLFAWNSVNATKQVVLDAAHDMRATTSDLREESSRRTDVVLRDSEPVFGALPEGYRTLEVAKERIARGEHARARRMLYGLLAVVDRIEPPARQEVEAQAGFLIADSLRLEGDAALESAGGQR